MYTWYKNIKHGDPWWIPCFAIKSLDKSLPTLTMHLKSWNIFLSNLKCQYQIVYETTHLAKLYQKPSLYLRTLHKLFVCLSRLSAIDSLINQASCILEHLGCAAPWIWLMLLSFAQGSNLLNNHFSNSFAKPVISEIPQWLSCLVLSSSPLGIGIIIPTLNSFGMYSNLTTSWKSFVSHRSTELTKCLHNVLSQDDCFLLSPLFLMSPL